MTRMVAAADSSRPSHRTDPVARCLREILRSASDEAAHQAERSIRDRARLLMQACRLAGARDRGERFLAELKAALAPELPVLTNKLIGYSQEADADEEMAQAEFLMSQNAATARRWRIALESEVAIHYDLILALRGVEAQVQ